MKVEYSETYEYDLKGINELIKVVRSDPSSIYKPPCDFDLEDIRINDLYTSFVAKAGDQIIGFIELRGKYPFQGKGSSADIILFIHPEHKRNGHATKLIKTVESFAQNETNLEKLIARIETGNSPSEQLFKGNNFKQKNKTHCGVDFCKDITH
jgi:RimJ/RimL family protein N-acetyltransferase